jgi:hypothetical protein
LQRAVRIERAAPGHPARPPQLQRTSPLERASLWLPAPLRLHTTGVYKSSGRTSKTSAVQYSPAVQFQPDTRELSFLHTESPLVV